MPVSQAQKKATAKWDKENMTTLGCKVKKSEAEQFKAYAKEQCTTANSLLKDFVLSSIQEEKGDKNSTKK